MQGSSSIHVEQIRQGQAAVSLSLGFENRPTRIFEQYQVYFHRVSAENGRNEIIVFILFLMSTWRPPQTRLWPLMTCSLPVLSSSDQWKWTCEKRYFSVSTDPTTNGVRAAAHVPLSVTATRHFSLLYRVRKQRR